MIRVVIADDHALIRMAHKMVLASTGRYEVVAETAVGAGFEVLASQCGAELVLLDLTLADCSGFEVLQRLRRALPSVKILVVTGSGHQGAEAEAFAAGADGFLEKHTTGSDVLRAVDAVMAGEKYNTSLFVGDGLPLESSVLGDNSLTPREAQIAQLITDGHTNKEIAAHLNISVLNARKGRQTVMRKLAGQDRLAIEPRSAGQMEDLPVSDIDR